MKKALILGIALGLIFAFTTQAVTLNLTGKVSEIKRDATNPKIGYFSLIKNPNWFQKITGAIFNQRARMLAPVKIEVTEKTKFYLRTTQSASFTEGSFADLNVNDSVVVRADLINNVYTALEVKITGMFIPIPKPIPPVKQCETDADCTWCGMSCVNKTEIQGKACPQVMPKPGTACQCVNNRCLVVPLTGPIPPVTFQNRAQILQEIERVKNQIKVLEQRLKELEKLLKTFPTPPASITQ